MKDQQPLEFYTILCGIFLFDGKKNGKDLTSWTERLSDPTNFREHIGRTYYTSFVNNILTGFRDDTAKPALEHHTSKERLTNPLLCSLKLTEETVISIPYVDFFTFTDRIGIFCMKVEFANPENANYETVGQLLSKLRNPSTTAVIDGRPTPIAQVIEMHLADGHHLAPDWNRYLNQLKLYTIINDPGEKIFSQAQDRTLFELAHAMPIGTITSGLSDNPTTTYFDTVMDKSTISVYNNWKAISLLDSFIRISCSYPDTFKSWEFDYLHIYVYCLYCKVQLYSYNSALPDLKIDRHAKNVRDSFVEFVNDYSLPYVSYKFLPNLLYEKMSFSLEIEKELSSMERKIDRLNEGYQNRKSRQLGALLLIISILSLASVVNDVSQWLVSMGTPSSWVYNPITILAGAGTLVVAGCFVLKKS